MLNNIEEKLEDNFLTPQLFSRKLDIKVQMMEAESWTKPHLAGVADNKTVSERAVGHPGQK